MPIADTEGGRELAEVLANATTEIVTPPPLRLPVGLHLDVSHNDYMADPGERPSLSSSVAATLASKAPLHGWYRHPRLGGGERSAPTPSTGRGSILHKLLLGKGQDVAVFDFDDFKREAARDARDAAIAEGRIPIVASKFEEFEKVAVVLRKRLADRGILLTGQSEVTGLWERDGVLCRMRADHLIVGEDVTVLDIKTCTNAAPEKIAADMYEYGDDVQGAAYAEGAEALIPEMAGRVRVRFVFCEAEAPNDVVVYDPPGDMRELGLKRWKRGREIWQRCLAQYGEKTEWPGYSLAPVKVGPPAWAVSRETEIEFNRMETSNGNQPF